MSWLREAINDGRTGLASTKRVVMLVSGLTMSACTLLLTIAAFFDVAVVPALSVFGGALSGLAGAGYVGGKFAEARRDSAPLP